MKKLLLLALTPLCLLAACGSETTATAPAPIASPVASVTPIPSSKPIALPSHTVKEIPLSPTSKRIEISSNEPHLSHNDCEALVNNYLVRAGTAGQVGVQKPNPKPPWNGKMLPFCVNNLDGRGTFFNDYFFQ